MTISPSSPPPKRRPASDVPGRPCSAAAALAVVGERWSLLVIREINFGNHRFDQIARNTGAARDILTARLRSLEESGVIYRRRYQEHPPRFEYHLTEAGKDLMPTINSLRTWGDRWIVEEPPVVFTHSCGHELDLVSVCAHCGKPVRPDDRTDLSGHIVTPGWDIHGPTESTR